MRNHTKKISTLIAVLALFGASLYAAYAQGAAVATLHPVAGTDLSTPSAVYSGVAGFWAAQFSLVMNALMGLTGNNLMSALILLAVIVEAVLLYPSVSIQLKQKKIHLFHKKLVDRFESGELALSATQQELHKLYDVNEKIHSRGAILVVLQIVVLVGVLAGLNLILQAKILVPGLSSGFNTALLSKPISMALPLLAGLFYAFHSLIKIAIKEREDYISPTQTGAALAFTVLGSAGVYYFASLFPVALSVYAVTLMAFATLRILFVEEHARSWGRAAHEQLINMLRSAKPHSDRFQYISRKWNHLPIVRHVNFHLLEEALSMSLGLLVALNILGAFQAQQGYAQETTYTVCGTPSAALKSNIQSAGVAFPTAWTAGDVYWDFKGLSTNTATAEYDLYMKRAGVTTGSDTPLDNSYCMSAAASNKTPVTPANQVIADNHQVNGVPDPLDPQKIDCTAFKSDNASNAPALCNVATCTTNFTLVKCSYRVVREGGILNVSNCPSNLTAGAINQVPDVTGGTVGEDGTKYEFHVRGTYPRVLTGATYIPVKGDTGIRVYDALNRANYNDTCTFNAAAVTALATQNLTCPSALEVIADRSQASLNKTKVTPKSINVIPGSTYRLRLKNNNVDNVTSYVLADNATPFVQEIKQDPTDPDVIELKIKSDAIRAGTATLTINDPTADTATCKFVFTLNLKGGAGQGALKPASPNALIPNAIGNSNVHPTSLVAGATSQVSINFVNASTIPKDGKIKVTFGSGFDVSGATGGTCSSMDGTLATSITGQTVTFIRNGDGTPEATSAQTCTLNGIINPKVSGSTGAYVIETTIGTGSTLDIDSTVAADTITPAVLTSTNVQPASLVAGAVSDITISFTSVNPIPANGKIKVTFGSGFDVSDATGGTCLDMSGTFSTTATASSQTVTLARQGDGAVKAAGAETCTISGIKNPGVSGPTGTYSISTTILGDAVIDQNNAVIADTITPGTLTETNVEPDSLNTNVSTDATITFTTVNPIPADGKIKVTFGSGFNVSGATGGTCLDMSGTFSATASGQTVTLARQVNSTVQAAGEKTCTISGIINPASPSSTGTYSIQTTTAANGVIDQDTAVAADSISTGMLTATNVELSDLRVNRNTTATVTFTTTNAIPANGKIKMTFASGFDLTDVNLNNDVTCSNMVGSFLPSKIGQTIIISQFSSVQNPGSKTCQIDRIRTPQTVGGTGFYSIQTTNSVDGVIDQDTEVTESIITN